MAKKRRKYSRSAGTDVKNEIHRYKRGKAKERAGWQRRQGQEPQAGHRHRPVEGAQEGQEGPAKAPVRLDRGLLGDGGNKICGPGTRSGSPFRRHALLTGRYTETSRLTC